MDNHGKALDSGTQNIYLAKLLIFQLSFPDFYLYLQLFPDSWSFLETDILQAKSTEERERSFKDRSELKAIWERADLQAFIRNTSSYAVPPPLEVVSRLLQVTNLVTEQTNTQEVRGLK